MARRPLDARAGRLRVLATVQDPRAVQAILAYLARSGAPAPPGPAPPAPPQSRSPPLTSALDAAPTAAAAPRCSPLDLDSTAALDTWGQRAIAMPTLPFAPSKRPVRVRPRVHRGARTWSDARCPSGGGVSRSYAARIEVGRPAVGRDRSLGQYEAPPELPAIWVPDSAQVGIQEARYDDVQVALEDLDQASIAVDPAMLLAGHETRGTEPPPPVDGPHGKSTVARRL
jgi:hypothetical protein